MTNAIDSVDHQRKAQLAASAIARATYLKQERLAQQGPILASTVTQNSNAVPRWLTFLLALRKR